MQGMHKRGMSKPISKDESRKAIKELIKSLKPYLPFILLSMIFIVTGVVCSILAPSHLKDLTNEIANNQASGNIDLDKLWKYATILIIFYAVNATATFVSGLIMNKVTQTYGYNLRKNISEKINKMPLRYFDTHPYGDTLSRVTNDVDTITEGLKMSVTSLLQSLTLLFGVLIAMFISNWIMALTVLVSLPLMILMITFITKLAVPQFKNRQKHTGMVNAVVQENYTGATIIKLFTAEEKRKKDFTEQNENLHKAMIKAQIFGGMMQPISSFISYFAYAAVCTVGGLIMAYTGDITFGTISAFLVYVNLFQSPLSQISQSMNSVQMSAAASARVFELLNEAEEENEDDKEYLLLKNGNTIRGEVEFKNVKFGYNESRIVIPDFSCSVKPGMKVAIVGPTGAGKTTLVNLLMRFYEVNGGEILIDGVSIKDMSRREIRDIFGMVLQDSWIFDGTVKENLAFSKENVTDEEINEAIKEACLHHNINALEHGINTQIKGDSGLSHGEKQLMTIARAFVENAPLLILDEATSNVDTRTEILIQKAMDSLTQGRTSFVIAHRLSTIKNADLILVLNEGNIVEQGTHESLLALDGFYAKIYNSQFDEEPELA